MDKKDLKSMNLEELTLELELLGEKKFRTAQVFQWIHEKLVEDVNEMTNLSQKLREK